MFEDSPRSVARTSLRLVPSESRLESPEAFRNGSTARETAGPDGGVTTPEVFDVSVLFDRWYTVPPASMRSASAAAAGIRYFFPFEEGRTTVAAGAGAIVCPSLARSRSRNRSALVW